MRRLDAEVARLPRPNRTQLTGIILGITCFLIPFLVPLPGITPEQSRMFSIFLLAICFWVSEAIPLVATAVLVLMLEVLMVAQKGLFPVGEGALKASDYFAAMANPVIILFLGGFLIADGAAKYGLDRNLAAVFLKPFVGSARLTVMGMMGITALLSMFMSNTATTATMFAVVIPIMGGLSSAKARSGLALSIPVAANVGGMGTPVGTPPNAIALGALQQMGVHVSFVEWMVMAVPLMLVVLAVSWWAIVLLFIPRGTPVNLEMKANFNKSTPAIVFYLVAASTVLLWMTESLHGISSNTIGFIPVVLLLALQVMDGNDLKNLDWSVLWLVAGGIALGRGVEATGLDKWMLGSVNWGALAPALVVTILAMVGFALSNVISHSASANLLIPIALGLGTSLAGQVNIVEVGVVVALGCSLGMMLPISTPPNAIAYSTKAVPTKDMVVIGAIVGVFGSILLALVMPPFWRLLGLV